MNTLRILFNLISNEDLNPQSRNYLRSIEKQLYFLILCFNLLISFYLQDSAVLNFTAILREISSAYTSLLGNFPNSSVSYFTWPHCVLGRGRESVWVWPSQERKYACLGFFSKTAASNASLWPICKTSDFLINMVKFCFLTQQELAENLHCSCWLVSQLCKLFLMICSFSKRSQARSTRWALVW